MAYKTVNPGQYFAVKSIKRASITGEEDELKKELGILLAVDHPNIVKLYEIYLDHKYIHLVTEYLEGGELDPKCEQFTEQRVAMIIRQSLQALNYLHELHIIHCDLKSENMLFDKHKKFVKLIDFGFANICKTEEGEEEIRYDEFKGTPYYIAPEVIHGDYDKRADLWSLGVVTYYLLSGR